MLRALIAYWFCIAICKIIASIFVALWVFSLKAANTYILGNASNINALAKTKNHYNEGSHNLTNELHIEGSHHSKQSIQHMLDLPDSIETFPHKQRHKQIGRDI